MAGERDENRILETIMLALTKPFLMLSPSLLHTPVDILAKAMIGSTIYSPPEEKAEILFNPKIFNLAKFYDEQNNKN